MAYLLYLAWGTWRDTGALRLEPATRRRSLGRDLASGITVNLLNPKLTVFFVAFLPQFAPSGSGNAVAHMLLLGGVFMAMTFLVFAWYAALAGALRDRVLRSEQIMRWLRRSFGVAFAGLATRLALQRQ